jgi:hypothetical protein
MDEPVSVNGANYNKLHILKFGKRNNWKCPKGMAFTISEI